VSYLDESFLSGQRERRRLAANYASMTDEELQKLARNADSLTELAWDALEDEMDRRHLEYSDDPAPEPRQEMEIRELVTIRQFRDLPEALLAKGSLESAGIECFWRTKIWCASTGSFQISSRHQTQSPCPGRTRRAKAPR